MENTVEAVPNTPKKIIAAIIVALFCLLIGGVIFWANKDNQKRQERLITLQEAKFKSDSLYTAMKSELAIYKQSNDDLYTKLVDKEEKLEQLYTKIKRLIAQAERDQTAKKQIQIKLKSLALEINNLNTYVEKQTKDIAELRTENQRLKKEKETLKAEVKAKAKENTELQQNSSTLEEDNKDLEKKVEEASILRIANLKTAGFRLRPNGKRVGVNPARRTEIIETCFEIVQNNVVTVGVNYFYLRIVDPKGQVLADPSRGSGQLIDHKGNKIAYSMKKTFDYDPNVFSICMEWNKTSKPFQSGTHQIEVYNKGRLVGSYAFSMK